MLKSSPIPRTRRGASIHPFGWFSENRQLVPWTAVLITLVYAIPCSGQYAESVLADEPFAYWRMNEAPGTSAPENSGFEDVPANYAGNVVLDAVPGLVNRLENSVLFDGVSGKVDIPDHELINANGASYEQKTVELWFAAADANTTTAQTLYEQGGTTRGLNLYVRDGSVYVGVWNANDDDGGATTPWPAGLGDGVAKEPGNAIFVGTPIESNTPYHVAVVYEGDPAGKEGTVTGYLNGEKFGEDNRAGLLFAHTDDVAIGGRRAESFYDDGIQTGGGSFFVGAIEEVALYDVALSAERIAAHYNAREELPTPEGDFNLDGNVDMADFLVLAQNFNEPGGYVDGNINFNPNVDVNDFLAWREIFQAQGVGAATSAAVPEPGASILWGLGSLGLMRRRRRRQS